MQAGGKSDEVGWGPYEACQVGGAIIATVQEHSYSRTHLMISMENQVVASTLSTMEINFGETFAIVSGIAGKSIRPEDPVLANKPWWASVYTSTQSANFGALFCSFNYQSVFNKTHCYFKDIDGVMADDFFIVSLYASDPMPSPISVISLWGFLAFTVLLGVALYRRLDVEHNFMAIDLQGNIRPG